MIKTLKAGALLMMLLFSLAACQEELPTPEDVPSQEQDASENDEDSSQSGTSRPFRYYS
ncbi:MAG: hypothetical protein AAGA66_15960 [Bacteroidota bacterium]